MSDGAALAGFFFASLIVALVGAGIGAALDSINRGRG